MGNADTTEKQAHLLSLFERYLEKQGVPPTLEDLRKMARLKSRGTVQYHVAALIEKGYLKQTEGKRRAMKPGRRFPRGIPLIGDVAAGMPIEAVENVERMVQVPPEIFRRRPDYLLRVRGDSMIDAGIRNGDWIAIRKTDTADNGDIVIAMRDGEVTVKEMHIDSGYVVLKPHNSSMKSIRIPADEINIVGVYTGGLIRPA